MKSTGTAKRVRFQDFHMLWKIMKIQGILKIKLIAFTLQTVSVCVCVCVCVCGAGVAGGGGGGGGWGGRRDGILFLCCPYLCLSVCYILFWS